jgi:hypothetical protein
MKRALIAALPAVILTTSCGGLFRPGGQPLPGPTISPTGSPTGTPIPGEGGLPGGPDQGEDPQGTTTEEPDFPG